MRWMIARGAGRGAGHRQARVARASGGGGAGGGEPLAAVRVAGPPRSESTGRPARRGRPGRRPQPGTRASRRSHRRERRDAPGVRSPVPPPFQRSAPARPPAGGRALVALRAARAASLDSLAVCLYVSPMTADTLSAPIGAAQRGCRRHPRWRSPACAHLSTAGRAAPSPRWASARHGCRQASIFGGGHGRPARGFEGTSAGYRPPTPPSSPRRGPSVPAAMGASGVPRAPLPCARRGLRGTVCSSLLGDFRGRIAW